MTLVPSLPHLHDVLGYRFRDGGLLIEALTHGSAVTARKNLETYQRLEFLGDRVLGLLIADLLLITFPQANEGELASRLSTLVCSATCAEIARSLDLGTHIIMSSSEERSGGRQKSAILADALESVIGAIYKDGGLESVRPFVRCHWEQYVVSGGGLERDSKTLLQEWAQGRGLPLPVYEIVARSGPDHAPLFEVKVSIQGLGPTFAKGKSRRHSEQAAATRMLLQVDGRED